MWRLIIIVVIATIIIMQLVTQHHSVEKSMKSVASSHVMLVECIAVEISPGEVSGLREETKPPTSQQMLLCFSLRV